MSTYLNVEEKEKENVEKQQNLKDKKKIEHGRCAYCEEEPRDGDKRIWQVDWKHWHTLNSERLPW